MGTGEISLYGGGGKVGWSGGSLGICLLDNNANEIITSIDILESQVKNCQAILPISSL